MEVVKRKRGRPRKQPIVEQKLPTYTDKYEEFLKEQLFKEELSKLVADNSATGEESPYYKNDPNVKHVKTDGIWDVKRGEKIHYFDPELSYEITGYRPITMTYGLDFDPSPFCEASQIYKKTGSYCEYPKDSKPYRDFWNEQFKRCVHGYTVGRYRVTGNHYFFLNFYHMDVVVNSEEEEDYDYDQNETFEDINQSIDTQVEDFPHFLAKQYEFFHYLELCYKVKKDCAMLKARGLGFSEILASLGVQPFITTKNYRSCYTAAADSQLRPVLEKCWKQLNWLSMNTNGGMKRLRQKIDNILHKRASLVSPDNIEYGRMSDIFGIVADHPRKVRGYRVHQLILEEAGSNPNFITSWIQGNALVELGGRKIGIRIGGGTGGDAGPQLAGLAKVFNNPTKFNVLPYKNFYTRDGKVQYTGFFIPAHEFSLEPKYLDHRGVTNSEEFKEYYEENRRNLDGSELLDYCAEHCFTPDEALLRQGDNLFDSVIISDRITQIRVHKAVKEPKKVALLWDKTTGNNLTKVRMIPSESSKILIIEEPLVDPKTNSTYKNLYCAGIDSIDMGVAESATDKDVSDFCIVIKKRVHGMDEPKYVAIYKDRPKDIRTAYDNAMKLLTWYGCQAMLEYTKISIQTYFKEKKKEKLFMSRPDFAISKAAKRKRSTLIGVQASETVIKHGLELVSNYVNDYCYEIDFDEMLEQLLNYSYQEKRKFDIIAAMCMCEIADEEMSGLKIVTNESQYGQWEDFGYYYDENGYKRKGVIPKR